MNKTIMFREQTYEITTCWKNDSTLILGFGDFIDNTGDSCSILCEYNIDFDKCMIGAWYGNDFILVYSEYSNFSVYKNVLPLSDVEVDLIKVTAVSAAYR